MLFTISINSNRDFTRLYKSGRSIVTPAFVCYFRENRQPYNRIGLTASKKIGNAVCRNRARRVLREAYRACELVFPIGYDIVFVARSGVLTASSTLLAHQMRKRVVPRIAASSAPKKAQER